ncbi:MAG: hypothetical protein AB7G37_11435 [Solirubrobacteraceae bacterium]
MSKNGAVRPSSRRGRLVAACVTALCAFGITAGAAQAAPQTASIDPTAAEPGGTLANGVEWVVTPPGMFRCAAQTWEFDQEVDVRFGVSGLNAPGESVQVPEGAEVESIDPLHGWDPATRVVSRISNASQPRISYFTLSGVTEFTVTGVGGCSWVRHLATVDVTADVPSEPPVVTVDGPTEDAEYYAGQEIPAAFGCEAVAPATIETCEGTVADGENIDTATPGTKTFTVKGVDSAGNETTKTVTYTVRKSRGGLRVEPSIAQVLPVTGRRGLLNLAPLARVSLTFEARMTDEGGKPVVGETIRFNPILGTCTAVTDADGVASCGYTYDGLLSLLTLGYTATFAGSDAHEPVSGRGHLAEVLGIGLL